MLSIGTPRKGHSQTHMQTVLKDMREKLAEQQQSQECELLGERDFEKDQKYKLVSIIVYVIGHYRML